MFVFRNSLSGKPLSKLSCVCLPLEKLVCFPEFTFRETSFQTFLCLFAIRKACQRKTSPVKEKFGLVSRKVFPGNLGEKHFSEVVKN
jgi:hypothetical protein